MVPSMPAALLIIKAILKFQQPGAILRNHTRLQRDSCAHLVTGECIVSTDCVTLNTRRFQVRSATS